MFRKRKKSKLLDVVKKMPPLYHTLPGRQYDAMKSQVLEWLCGQPEVREWLWNHLKSSDYVSYDPSTRLWSGADNANEQDKTHRTWTPGEF